MAAYCNNTSTPFAYTLNGPNAHALDQIHLQRQTAQRPPDCIIYAVLLKNVLPLSHSILVSLILSLTLTSYLSPSFSLARYIFFYLFTLTPLFYSHSLCLSFSLTRSIFHFIVLSLSLSFPFTCLPFLFIPPSVSISLFPSLSILFLSILHPLLLNSRHRCPVNKQRVLKCNSLKMFITRIQLNENNRHRTC